MTQPATQLTEDGLMTKPWDPIQVLGINQLLDGNFNCSGVNSGTTIGCGWILRGGSTNINTLLDEMSELPPAEAIKYLSTLAEMTLCMNHKEKQTPVKIKAWTRAINNYSRITSAGPVTPSRPPKGPMHAYLATGSLPSSVNGSPFSSFKSSVTIEKSVTPDSSSRDNTPYPVEMVEDFRSLREEIRRLKERVSSLEAKPGERLASEEPSSRSSSKIWGFKLRGLTKSKE